MSNKIVSGGLSAAAALAASSGAYAAIVSIPVPANIVGLTPPSGTGVTGANWDVNGDGVGDYNFSFRNVAPPSTGINWQANMNTVTGGANAGVVSRIGFGSLTTFVYGTRLAASASIGPVAPSGVNNNVGGADSWNAAAQVILGSWFGGTLPYAGFATTGGAYAGQAVRGWVGFRFNSPGGLRYGGLEVEVIAPGATGGGGAINFFQAAFEDSGAAFVPANIPAPGSIAALAMGALACGRRSRRVA